MSGSSFIILLKNDAREKKKEKKKNSSSRNIHLTAMGRRLQYRITQCYLPLDTSGRTPALTPARQTATNPKVWKAELTWSVGWLYSLLRWFTLPQYTVFHKKNTHFDYLSYLCYSVDSFFNKKYTAPSR